MQPMVERLRRLIGDRSLLIAVKTVHSAIFLSVASCILLVLADGISGRPTRRTATAALIVTGECAVFVANRGVCPLTPVAESLGPGRGSVSDIFLPDWFARHLAAITTPVFALGLLLNARALRSANRRARPEAISPGC
jgi:hypothetical protein